MIFSTSLPLCASLALALPAARTELRIVSEHVSNDEASRSFRFERLARPATSDAASAAELVLIAGERDGNSGELSVLTDGRLPSGPDEPRENFFFAGSSASGRLRLDLGRVLPLGVVRTYSWHPGARGPQNYTLYASDGAQPAFDAAPTGEPEAAGWQQLARVDTSAAGGGQHGVSIEDSRGALGSFRYLLFDVARSDAADAYAQTFFSEIDVLDLDSARAEAEAWADTPRDVSTFELGDGTQLMLDSTQAPDLTLWAERQLEPVMREWYPRIVALLPSEGFEPYADITLRFTTDMGDTPASAGGPIIRCNAQWFRANRDGEALGAVVHEMVHLVQRYARRRREDPDAQRFPGWLVEGIPDYVRWFLFEPESRGAEITSRNIERASFDTGYRVSANFLDWVVRTKEPELVRQLNAAARAGSYREGLWLEATGQDLETLGAEWKAAHAERLARLSEQRRTSGINTLSEEERAAGWRLLFDGESFRGWHNFRRKGVQLGWQIEDGAIACVDPHHAGDLSTQEEFGAFELELDYNISAGGNSGIMFHVTTEGGAAWATGPEFQLEDNAAAADPQRCGWLYALYRPELDPATGQPLDATRPAGEWNHVRLLITPQKCEHVINGVSYFDYVIGSEDFAARVAASKFGRMPLFAKSSRGAIVLQGDHGQVSFRNVKVRVLDDEE